MENSPQDMLNGLSTEDLQKYADNDLNGMSTEGLQIIAKLPEDNSAIDRTQFQAPQWQGGALSPANIQAQEEQKKAEGQVEKLDPQIAAVGAAYNASYPASAYAMQAMRNKPTGSFLGMPTQNVPRAITGAGALLQDVGMIANPITGEAISLAGKGIGIASKAIGGSANRIIDSFKGPSSLDLKASLEQRKVDIKNYQTALEDAFKDKSKDIVNRAKEVIPKISKDMTTAYGQGLEDIFNKLDDPLQAGSILKKNAPAITNQEMVTHLDSLIGKVSNDPLVVKSDAYQKAVKMLDYYKNGSKSTSGLVDESGRVLSSQAPESVDIKNLIAQTRDIRGTINSSTMNGSSPVTAQDYFATQFDKTIGNLLKNRVEGFSDLQKSYAPMANTRKVAYKLFKPFADEDSATSFLNRIKNNNMKSSDYQLVKFLQSGGRVAGKDIAGMGEFSKDLTNIGDKLKTLKSGNEVRQLGADMAKKSSDESFRNKFFLWTLGGIGLGSGVKKGAEMVINHH